MENQLLGEHVIPLSPRNLDQAFKHRIPAGNNPHSLLPALRLQVRHSIKLPVLQEGEGLLLSYNDWRQVGTNGLIKVKFQLILLFFG